MNAPGSYSWLLVLLALCGCEPEASPLSADEILARAQPQVEIVELVRAESALVRLSVMGIDPGASAATMVAQARTALLDELEPRSCITQLVADTSLRMELSECSAPSVSLTGLTGGFEVSYVNQGSAPTLVNLRDVELQFGEGFVLSAPVRVELLGAGQMEILSTTSNGFGPTGQRLTWTGRYRTSWGGSCVELDSTLETTVDAVRGTTDIARFEQCGEACPHSGTLTWTRALEPGQKGAAEVISLRYDGTALPRVITADEVVPVPLRCGG